MAKKKGIKVMIGNGNWRAIKTLLKTGTYFLIGAIATYVMTAIQGGANIKDALIIGASLGLVAGIKNFVKHQFGIDLDLTNLKK